MAFEDIESVVAAAAAASDGAPAPFCDTYDNDLDGGLVNPSDLHITAPASPAYTTSSTSSPRGVKREYDEEDEEDDDDISNADKSTTSAVTPKKKTLRKRAKTQEEKEQRAHERIMRNRLAAQTSRERKREYVTQLESQNTELERDIKRLTKDNDQLRGTVTDLNKRLSQLEKLLAVLTPATDSTASSSLGKSTAIATTSLSTEPIGLRSPAVTASDPQRRSVSSRRKPELPIQEQLFSLEHIAPFANLSGHGAGPSASPSILDDDDLLGYGFVDGGFGNDLYAAYLDNNIQPQEDADLPSTPLFAPAAALYNTAAALSSSTPTSQSITTFPTNSLHLHQHQHHAGRPAGLATAV
ncbi:transcription factor that binds to CRE motif [Savitreella phatthalungensis]